MKREWDKFKKEWQIKKWLPYEIYSGRFGNALSEEPSRTTRKLGKVELYGLGIEIQVLDCFMEGNIRICLFPIFGAMSAPGSTGLL